MDLRPEHRAADALRATGFTKAQVAYLAVLAVLTSVGLAQEGADTKLKEAALSADSAVGAQIHVPNRPFRSLFQGEQGRQGTEIYFDPSTRIVTVKLLVQDPQGYFIPNIRRENFVVYENGVRQQNTTVEIEHAAVTLGMLIESGGRYQALNEVLAEGASSAAHQFLSEIGRKDRIAIWKYGNNVEQICDFSQGLDARAALGNLVAPSVSEVNFYDALIVTLGRMQTQNGRKALLLISSGIDTFSKANYEEALEAARRSGVPIYAINLAAVARSAMASTTGGPYSRIDWKRGASELQAIATASGGRMYSPETTLDLAGIYDDLMENLRVRYVITYKSDIDADARVARTVRIELVDSRTGKPVKIVDAKGRTVRWQVIVEGSYVPGAMPTAG